MTGFLPDFFRDKQDKKDKNIYMEVFLKSPVGMCVITHPGFLIKIVNEAFADLFGLGKDEITGKLFAEIWTKCRERDEFMVSLRTAGTVFEAPYTIETKTGRIFSVRLSGAKIDDDNFLICALPA
ncbi:PAS domain S-box protein [Methanoplanus sp. FWC-SCC4]|uniref:PAS domain S-box protein n=1 Tax=Methanochimaera problematica TaxID=2609417 RepID=A0AA97F9A8_9EURY|nr:PAS domain-containing protein [Methanoplanus sp. FWC-SCC4]WOF15235.1 PAS domain S-box protein [Methanoplanus sp. FWC-SCC4]